MRTFRKFLKKPLVVASVILLLTFSLMAIFAPLVTTYAFDLQDIDHRLETATSIHWMGTDSLGRDLYSRIVYGARMSLSVGLLTALLSITLGTVVGAVAGYRGGLIDSLLMRIVDLFTIFPSVLTAILLTVVLGRGLSGILISLVLTSWVLHARLVRNLMIKARGLPYVESARAMGLSGLPIVVKHILPNLMGPMLVSLTYQIPNNIMAESFLSFIGLGLQPPLSSWGILANEGFRAMKSYPHLTLYPGLALFLTLTALQILGDALRDGLDPHSRKLL
ncbi:MAG: ABC transporter permease [Proteobacteria bacterium]|nr:MAG: ABC transporter permease [Pseudomonadota bacterium]